MRLALRAAAASLRLARRLALARAERTGLPADLARVGAVVTLQVELDHVLTNLPRGESDAHR